MLVGDYLGTLTQMDVQIGRIRQLLRDKGVADNTMVWYTADNGPHSAGRDRNKPNALAATNGKCMCACLVLCSVGHIHRIHDTTGVRRAERAGLLLVSVGPLCPYKCGRHSQPPRVRALGLGWVAMLPSLHLVALQHYIYP